MARYLLISNMVGEDHKIKRDPLVYEEGTFEEMKSKLSDLVENNPKVSDKTWERVQLLEPENLPIKVAGITFFVEGLDE